jgi:Raf kinase inhibitor-like YbhB/YbcL family protein
MPRGRRPAPRAAVLVAAAALLAAAGCGGERTEARKESADMMTMTLQSPAFAAVGTVPVEHTCDGADRSPELRWSAPPPGARSLAVFCEDPDAPGKTWVHWVLYDLPPGTTVLPAGVPPDPRIEGGGIQGTNDFGNLGYGGPCPPRGKAHRYVFHVVALDVRLDLPPGRKLSEVRRAIEGHVLGEGELTGIYGRR